MPKKKKAIPKKLQKNLIVIGALVVLLIIVAIFFSPGGKHVTEDGTVIQTCGENTVILENRNLCWQQSSMPRSAENWNDANTYCENLDLGGHEDWRLPSLAELEQIVVYDATGATIDSNIFTDTLIKHYWTSSIYLGVDNAHEYIHFEKGYQGHALDYNSGYVARCVRTISLF